jgi:hypothetical protein
MGPVLFLLIFVVLTAFIAMRNRAKRSGEAAQKQTVLEALAPLVAGAVSKNVLTGRYKEYTVTAETGVSGPPGLTSQSASPGPQVLRVHITSPSLMTGQAWQFRNTSDATHIGGGWRFMEPGAEFPFGRMLSRAADIPMPDAQLEDRLRAAGIEAALDHLPQSSVGWLPEVAFAGAMGRNLLERYERAGRAMPAEAQEQAAAIAGLRIEFERQRFDDPRPEQFRQVLDTALDIIEINKRANP